VIFCQLGYHFGCPRQSPEIDRIGWILGVRTECVAPQGDYESAHFRSLFRTTSASSPAPYSIPLWVVVFRLR